MTFCTAINCMDGRVQLPVIEFLQKRFSAEYVDIITEPGPNLILSEGKNTAKVQSIIERLKISVEGHQSKGLAIIGHHDCAGNPSLKNDQIVQIKKAIQLVQRYYETIEIIGLWVDENWDVHEVSE